MNVASLVSLKIGAANDFLWACIHHAVSTQVQEEIIPRFIGYSCLVQYNDSIPWGGPIQLPAEPNSKLHPLPGRRGFTILIAASAIYVSVGCSSVSAAEKGIGSSNSAQCLRCTQPFNVQSNGVLLLLPGFGVKRKECKERQR